MASKKDQKGRLNYLYEINSDFHVSKAQCTFVRNENQNYLLAFPRKLRTAF